MSLSKFEKLCLEVSEPTTPSGIKECDNCIFCQEWVCKYSDRRGGLETWPYVSPSDSCSSFVERVIAKIEPDMSEMDQVEADEIAADARRMLLNANPIKSRKVAHRPGRYRRKIIHRGKRK